MANFGTYGLNYWETVEDRLVHAARRLTSIEFSFDPCTFTAIVPGVYPEKSKMCKKCAKMAKFFELSGSITGTRLKINGYMLRCV